MVRSHVLDYLSWTMPAQSFEILTPLVRVRIPHDFLNTIVGGRAAIIERGLPYDHTDIRISILDRSDDERLNFMFNAVYNQGELLSPIVELLVELIDARTGEVFFTANEFSRPVSMTFTMMNNAGHLRPAGFMFRRAWLEFMPYRTLSPNEITTSSIFPGVSAIMHNKVSFNDVLSTHWGFMQSYTAAYSGIVAPTEQLAPDTPITRGEFVQLLSFVLQLPRAEAEVSGFVDVLPSNVFFDGVSRLFNMGMLGPHQHNARFYPNAIITREEIASIIGMAIAVGEPVRESHHRPLSFAFTDFQDFSNHHLANIQTTVDFGVMVGYPDSSFRPQTAGTRIYALQSVMNLARLLGVIDEI
jgi:hypothetical protein